MEGIIRALTRQNLSLGFPKNQPAQLQRLDTIVKFHLQRVLICYFPISKFQRLKFI